MSLPYIFTFGLADRSSQVSVLKRQLTVTVFLGGVLENIDRNNTHGQIDEVWFVKAHQARQHQQNEGECNRALGPHILSAIALLGKRIVDPLGQDALLLVHFDSFVQIL